MINPARRAAVLAIAVAACVTASASCGSSDPLAGQSAHQIAAAAAGNLHSAPGFTLRGTFQSGGSTVTGAMSIIPGRGCEGTVSQSGKGSVRLVVIGNRIWLQPDRQWLVSRAGSGQATQMASRLNGRYLAVTAPAGQSSGICSAGQVAGDLGSVRTLVRQPVTSIGGKSVVPLADKASGRTVYVTDTRTPEIVSFRTSGAGGTSAADITYRTVSLAPPPAADTVPSSQLGI